MKKTLPFPSEKNRLIKSMILWPGLLSFFFLTFNHQSWMFPYQSWIDSFISGLHEMLFNVGLV